MKQLKLRENWTEKKVLLKNKYPDLTEEDLSYTPGEEDQLIEAIARRLDISPEETRHIVRQI
ncbi:MAG TPA: hypothetical protein VK112_12685 [Fodinibius sp.]|nr:hypothetical protein [Fodinibius sp.]